ncbi:MAG TPA: alkaline phosphatase PhoX [Alphaproteobacteria bacterium]
MTEQINNSRRDALKLLAGVPMLPLATGAAGGFFFGGLSSAFAAGTASFASATFTAMPAPNLTNPAAMAVTTVGSRLTVTLNDKTEQAFDLAYEPFFITGDMVPNGKGGKILAGGYYDIANKPIVDKSVAGKERQFFSDAPDGTSLLSIPGAKVAGVKGNTVFAVVQFEYTTLDQKGGDTYGALPSPIAVLTLDQNPKTGKLNLVKYFNVDTSKAHGLWITCGASLTPWNSHLSSEEYEPDAQFLENTKYFKSFSKNLYGDETKANPYHYGHMPEITVHADGTGTVTKHYNMGRLSHELVQVMPDERTVLMGDDATNSGLFMFVADKAKDLSAGTLYVAKFGEGLSVDPAAPGAALTWIKLGHATSAEIEKMANTLKPSDIMQSRKEDPNDPSFKKIFYNGVANWIKINPGMEKAAAFLETHRYAYLAGGSMGFTKMEGTTVNAKDKVAYSALQNIVDSMVKGGKGWNAESNIAFDKKLDAGGVLEHKLGGGQTDNTGAAIVSEWVPMHSKMLLIGEDIPADALGNLANPDKVGNPDNLKFSEKLRTLFIGEDSGYHVNNFLWAYNIDTKQLSRIMSVPAGGESTGLHAVDELNGWTYIMSNFQHAGDWSKTLHGKVQPTLDPLVRANYKDRYGAAVGYLTAISTSMKLAKI